jgi:hypothetical protein
MRPIEIDVLATNEKASGPGYILATGGVAWAEDVFIEASSGKTVGDSRGIMERDCQSPT